MIKVDGRADNEWTPEALKQLSETLKDNEVAVVLHHRQPSDEVKAAIGAAGSRLVVVSTDGADPVVELEGNVDQVIKVLAGA